MYLPTKMGKNNSSKSTLSIQSFLKTRFTTANLLKVKEIGNMKGKKKKKKEKRKPLSHILIFMAFQFSYTGMNIGIKIWPKMVAELKIKHNF